MKKFLCLICLCCFILPVFAISEKQEAKMQEMIKNALQTKNVDDFNATLDYYLKLVKKEKVPVEITLLDLGAKLNYERYNVVLEEKYNKKSKYYVDLALLNGTKNTATVVIGLALADFYNNKKEIIRYYDYLNMIDPKVANELKPKVTENLSQIKQSKDALKYAVGYTIGSWIMEKPSASSQLLLQQQMMQNQMTNQMNMHELNNQMMFTQLMNR